MGAHEDLAIIEEAVRLTGVACAGVVGLDLAVPANRMRLVKTKRIARQAKDMVRSGMKRKGGIFVGLVIFLML
jgi:hypothetical protein